MAKRSSRRKPLSNKSVNIIPNDDHEHDHVPKKANKKNEGSKKETSKKTNNIESRSDEQTFVQIKGDDTLYPFSTCKKTGVIKFKPKKSRKLVVFDSKKHKIITQTPEISVSDEGKTEEIKEKKQKKGGRSRRPAPQSYNEEEEEVEVEDIVDKDVETKTNSRKKKAAPKSYAEDSFDDNEEEEEKKYISAKKAKKTNKNTATLRDDVLQRAAQESMEDCWGDWRAYGVIDY